ncbi:MAG: hypothetical protein HY306_12895 [Nitrosomonadales bacterium]|nr:hypothetical protein [Nitrosomonadales bacterium]
MNMKQLEAEFSDRLHDSIRQAQGLGYNPSRFEQMLATLGALKLAKKLVLSGDLQYGLKEMIKLDRKDLTLESIMLEPKFKSLFSAGELEAASWRLSQVQLP